MTLSNSLLSSAVIAVIIVIVSGYVISYGVDMDTVADIMFTGMLETVYAATDTTAPVISITGDDPVAIFVGDSYDDSDVICTDGVDPSPRLTPDIEVDTLQAGEYTVTYSCVDNAANSAEQVTRIVIVRNILSLIPVDNIKNNNNLELDGALGVTVFESGGNRYAAVTGHDDDGVQILNITKPSDIIAMGGITDNDSNLELDGVFGITTFKSNGNTYAIVAARGDDGVQILNVTNPSNITATDSMDDTDDTNLELDGAQGIATFKSNGNTYAIVASLYDDGVQILNITNPSNITATDSMDDTDDTNLELDGAQGITTFESDGDIYAAVAANRDDGVQILNITDPSNIIAADSITSSNDVKLIRVSDIITFKSGSDTYAATTSASNNGSVQILNITDPYKITAAGNIIDDGVLLLGHESYLTVFKSGSNVYAAVASSGDRGVQILNITDPYSITVVDPFGVNPADRISDTADRMLHGASGITTFESDGGIYVIVAAATENGVQIIRVDIAERDYRPPQRDTTPPVISITGDDPVAIFVGDSYDDSDVICTDGVDPSPRLTPDIEVDTLQAGAYTVIYSCTDDSANSAEQVARIVIVRNILSLVPVDNIRNNNNLELDGALGVTVFESGGNRYAAVTGRDDDGVQILNITTPSDIIAMGGITDNDSNLELDGAEDITTFKSGGHTYAAVAAFTDSGVQILNVTNPSNITATASINNDSNLELEGATGIAVFKSNGNTYAAVTARLDDGVQILNITDPSSITATDSIDDADDPDLELLNAFAITTFESDDYTYAAVAARRDNGVQILNITDPSNIIAADSITSSNDVKLIRVSDIITFKSGSDTYAATTSASNNGSVQILNITDPYKITAAGNIIDDGVLLLGHESYLTVFKSGSNVYAAVASSGDRGVQILNITDPYSITVVDPFGVNPADRISDTADRMLHGASGITTFESDGGIYVIVAAAIENGVQIIRVDITERDDPLPDNSSPPGTPPPASNNTPPVVSNTDRSLQKKSNTQNDLIADSDITIDGQRYDLGSGITTTITPHDVITGQTTDIVLVADTATDIIHFTVYLNLHGNDITYSNSDTYIRYDHGTVQIHDPHGFISDSSITITEDREQSRKKIIDTTIEFEGEMGLTNIVLYMWNEDRGSTFIRIFDALDITLGTEMFQDPEPQILLPDPEPQILLPDPEPQNYNGTAVTTPPDTELSGEGTISIIRIWAGFEHGSVTDDDLLQALNLDYYDNHIPNWVMTELAVLVSKGNVTTDEFVTSLAWVLDNL